jgi:hypothetical protein
MLSKLPRRTADTASPESSPPRFTVIQHLDAHNFQVVLNGNSCELRAYRQSRGLSV